MRQKLTRQPRRYGRRSARALIHQPLLQTTLKNMDLLKSDCDFRFKRDNVNDNRVRRVDVPLRSFEHSAFIVLLCRGLGSATVWTGMLSPNRRRRHQGTQQQGPIRKRKDVYHFANSELVAGHIRRYRARTSQSCCELIVC